MTSLSVLHITPYLAPAWAHGHVPGAVWSLAREQVARGWDVSVLTTDAMAPHERLPRGASTVEGVQIVRVRNAVGLAMSWLEVSTPIGWSRAARTLLSRRPQMVHLHELRTLETVLITPIMPRHTILVASTHGLESGIKPRTSWVRAQERLLRPAWNRIDHLIVESAGEVKRVRQLAETNALRWTEANLSVATNSMAGDGSVLQVYERLLWHR